MRYHPLHHKKTSHDKRRLLIGDIFGWIGAVLILGAYFLISLDIIAAHTYLYQILNIAGAGGLLVLGISRKAYPSVATNTAWILIGIFAIASLMFSI